jgi:hypothetical protein
MSDPSTIAAAMRAEDEARRASGIRITYLPGPIARDARGMTQMPCNDDPDTFDGAWKLCDGVFCNTYPDVAWGREEVMKRVARRMCVLPTLHRTK